MNNSQTYPWQELYVSAVLETEPRKLSDRIFEAQLAIEHRVLEGPPLAAPEHRAIEVAWRALVALKK